MVICHIIWSRKTPPESWLTKWNFSVLNCDLEMIFWYFQGHSPKLTTPNNVRICYQKMSVCMQITIQNLFLRIHIFWGFLYEKIDFLRKYRKTGQFSCFKKFISQFSRYSFKILDKMISESNLMYILRIYRQIKIWGCGDF